MSLRESVSEDGQFIDGVETPVVSEEVIDNCGRQAGSVRIRVGDALDLGEIQNAAKDVVTEEVDWNNSIQAFL